MRLLPIISIICIIPFVAESSVFTKFNDIENAVVRYLDTLDAHDVFYDIDTRNAAFFYFTKQIAPEFLDSISTSVADSMVHGILQQSSFGNICGQDRFDCNTFAADIMNLLFRMPSDRFSNITNQLKTLHANGMINSDVAELFSSASDFTYYPTNNITEDIYRNDWGNFNCYYVPYHGSNDTVIVSRETTKNDSLVRVYDFEFFGMPTRLYFAILDNQSNYTLKIRFKNSFSAIDNYSENSWACLPYERRREENMKLSANVSYECLMKLLSFACGIISRDIEISRITKIDIRLAMLGDLAISASINSSPENLSKHIEDSKLITDLKQILGIYNLNITTVNLSDVRHMNKEFFLYENITTDYLKTICPEMVYDCRIILGLKSNSKDDR